MRGNTSPRMLHHLGPIFIAGCFRSQLGHEHPRRYPQFGRRYRFLGFMACVAFALPMLALPPFVFIVLAAAAAPFIWLFALVRRKK